VSLDVPFGPFFAALEPPGGSRSARSGAVPKGEVRKENDVGLDTWGGRVYISRVGDSKMEIPAMLGRLDL